MAIMRASGSYTRIVDESFTPVSLTVLEMIIPMLTVKGVIGSLNRVSIDDYEDIVGYDLAYNTNYLGLKEMLESVSYLDILRLNKDPYYGNGIFRVGGDPFSKASVEDPEDIEALRENLNQTHTIETAPGPIDLANPVLVDTLEIYDGVTLIGHDDGLGALVADGGSGLTGTIAYDTGLCSGVSTTAQTVDSSWNFTVDRENEIAFWMKNPGDWDNLAVDFEWYTQDFNFATTTPIDMNLLTEAGELKLYDTDGTLLAHENAGNWVADGGSGISGAITRTGVLPYTSFTLIGYDPLITAMTCKYVAEGEKRYNLNTYRIISASVYQLLITEAFSIDSGSTEYLDGLDLTYVGGYVYKTSITAGNLSEKIDLSNATNGTTPLASELDLTPMDPSNAVAVAMNGITDISLANAFMEKAESLNMSIFVDAPNYAKYVDLFAWQTALYATEFAQLTGVSDQVATSVGTVSVYPSVNLVKTYAKMIAETGFLYYPPAGYDFAAIAAESLLETDYLRYADQMKYYKINYQKVGSAGPVIWEQRTRYAFESDLTYANTVWTIRAVQSEAKNFMDNLTFKILTPTILQLVTNGLESLMRTWEENGFVWTWKVEVPSWATVIELGEREVDIKLGVQVAKDGEVFDIAVILSNTAIS